ncbi:putative nuclease HARBI1 [Panicum miliaceum]|uniref:Nuclease HARBI1 n=1 Tax=Panicum miliaceum TaxID=4540 RepID=A0A3L6T7S8_PANMI|nr:putative nuclease HARBI1 [Panicum miliaceum]
MSEEAGMPHQSDTPSCSDDSEDSDGVDPTGIYTMEEFITEQSVLHNFLERITVKIQAKIEAQQTGTSRRRSGSRRFVGRNHEQGHERLVADFFSENPICNDQLFRIRYRMRRPLFLRIVRALGEWSPYFTRRRDGFYRQGLSPLQKCTAAIRMLARGSPADAVDEYVQIGESTAMECLERFAEGLIDQFGGEYLRCPTSADMQHLLQIGEECGFPGMLGSIGCMHWEWDDCPPKWMCRLNHSDYGAATMFLEAVASQDLWIWHGFFGVVGSNSDIIMLNQSLFFTEVLKGQAPRVQFSINKRQYDMGYYLADGIYPEWTAFVKTIPHPQTEKERLFAQYQEEARKGTQRAFGVLRSRFPIVCGPVRFFQRATLGKIIQACIILHNMTIEDEKDMTSAYFEPSGPSGISAILPSNINNGPADCFATVLQRNDTICAQPAENQIRRDLVDHIWQQFGLNQR